VTGAHHESPGFTPVLALMPNEKRNFPSGHTSTFVFETFNLVPLVSFCGHFKLVNQIIQQDNGIQPYQGYIRYYAGGSLLTPNPDSVIKFYPPGGLLQSLVSIC
jgi:hypothetical protein